jgi:hypothetical protein
MAVYREERLQIMQRDRLHELKFVCMDRGDITIHYNGLCVAITNVLELYEIAYRLVMCFDSKNDDITRLQDILLDVDALAKAKDIVYGRGEVEEDEDNS